MMEITVQYFDGCPHWTVMESRILAILDHRSDVTLVRQTVETAEQADALGFRGSPTMLIDGRDPFAEDGAPSGLACRFYATPDGPAGSPTMEQLRVALDRAAGRRATT